MDDLPKGVRKALGRIRDQAYQAQLWEALRDLDSEFAAWRKGLIDSFKLADLIHEFHHGPNRELYRYYTRVDPFTAAARAIATGLVPRDDVPSRVLDVLKDRIAMFERLES